MRIWILGIIFLLISFGFYRVYFPPKISVHPNRALIWKDFKQVDRIAGRESINAKCISTTDFEINRISKEGGFLRIDLHAKIELQEELSQVSTHFLAKSNKATKEQVLHHENGHFKVAQIIGRRIVNTVDAFKFDPKNYKTQLDSIVKSNYREWALMDRKYDQETTKPRNLEKQREWDLFFKNELDLLNGK
jgi:hypothetical protein